jgi:photosystem II stability/assembly factor-like uncharacterized protein
MSKMHIRILGPRAAHCVAVLLLGTVCAFTQEQKLYMSVLSSRAHQWNRNDYPLIGLFTSSDNGGSWQHLGWREYIRMFHSLEGPDGTLWSACGNGVLRSLDGGRTWKVTTGWQITEVTRMAVDANRAEYVYAASAYGPIRSTDRGDSWCFITDGLTGRFCAEVCVDRLNGDHLLLAAESGLYSSADRGEHWHPTALKGKAIRTVVQSPIDGRRFWAGTEEEGVWSSSDCGETWETSNQGLNHATVYTVLPGGEGRRMMFAGTHGSGVYRSTDEGRTWVQCTGGLKDLDVHALVLTGGPRPLLFAATMGDGLYQSEDLGDTWTFNSQHQAQVWGLTVGMGGREKKK